MKRCKPWGHDWYVRRVTVSLFDLGARGILKTCCKCGKVKAL